LARPFLIYFGIVFLSVAASGFTALSVRFFLRQSVLVAAFLAVSHFGPRISIRNIIALFVLTADLNSLYSLMEFLGAGGAIRAFGLAGRGYGDHVMLAFVFSSVYYLWTDDLRGRIFWGVSALIMVGALAATQTRASAITAGWALIVIIILAIRYGRRIRCRIPRKSLTAAILLLLLIFPILVFYTPVFEGIMYRFGRIGLQASGTILLRISLWKAALAAFASNPLLGIGAGNFPMVYNWVPNVRFDPIFFFVSGLSAHAVIFTALAETGLLGFLSMYYFFGRAVKTAYRNIKGATIRSDMAATHCLFIAALAVLGSSIYAGSWFWGSNSYHMVIVFGLIASFRHQPEKLLSGGKSA
jgi:O-antigen ligase